MYCGLGGIEGTFRMVVGRKVSIDESLAQAITKHSGQLATNYRDNECWVGCLLGRHGSEERAFKGFQAGP